MNAKLNQASTDYLTITSSVQAGERALAKRQLKTMTDMFFDSIDDNEMVEYISRLPTTDGQVIRVGIGPFMKVETLEDVCILLPELETFIDTLFDRIENFSITTKASSNELLLTVEMI